MATGIAISNGQGVAMTSTARKRTGSPLITQAQSRHSERHRRVDRAQLVAQTPQLGPLGFGLAHHFHDFGVARIRGAFGGADGQGRIRR